MNLSDVESQALQLSEDDRVELVLSVMSTLGASVGGVSDAEVDRRDLELETRETKPLSHAEFMLRVQEERHH